MYMEYMTTFIQGWFTSGKIICMSYLTPDYFIYTCKYIYLFHTQSTHIDKCYINSNTTMHRINDKYIFKIFVNGYYYYNYWYYDT